MLAGLARRSTVRVRAMGAAATLSAAGSAGAGAAAGEIARGCADPARGEVCEGPSTERGVSHALSKPANNSVATLAPRKPCVAQGRMSPRVE